MMNLRSFRLLLALTVSASLLHAQGGGTVSKGNLFATFHSGGPVMYLLLFLGVIGLGYAVERFLALRQRFILPDKIRAEYDRTIQILKDSEDRNPEVIKNLANNCSGSRAEGALLFKRFLNRGYGDLREMEQILQEYTEVTIWNLQKNVRVVGIVAQVAPLLGLFGTVIGMISAFDEVANQGLGKSEALAQGIGVALLTTAFGLIIALPSTIFYHRLMERSRREVLRLFNQLHEFLLVWHEPQAAETRSGW